MILIEVCISWRHRKWEHTCACGRYLIKANEFSLKRIVAPFFVEIATTSSPFLFLTLDLPPPPLFQDEIEKNIIPQVIHQDTRIWTSAILSSIVYNLYCLSYQIGSIDSHIIKIRWAHFPSKNGRALTRENKKM